MRFVIALVVALAGCERVQSRPPVAPVAVDVPYVANAEALQHLDLYVPTSPFFATIVFVYGGGWHSGSGKCCVEIARRLVSLGFGCVLVSHRLSPPEVFPAHEQDVASAFAWTKQHILEHGGDPSRIFVVGHSSGAQLALLLASDPRWLAPHGMSPNDIAGVVGLSTPTDLEPHADGHGFGDALLHGHGGDAFSRDPTTLRDASPVEHISAQLPRTLLIVGDHDMPMLADDARAFATRAAAVGKSVTVRTAKDRDHMGIVAALAEPDSDVVNAVASFVRGGPPERVP